MNNLYLSPSLHHIHHRKQPYLYKQKALNQNRSLSPIHIHQQISTKSIYSSSYTSLNSYLKEFNLTNKDLFELRQALKTIFHYIQPKIICNHKQLLKQRLTSPYLQQQLNSDDQSSLPLYTNEYFIRNGLLNHNDGPNIHDNHCQSINLCYSNHSKPRIHLQTCPSSCYSSPSLTSNSMMLTSSVNISLPLELLSNQKYLFTALTSNFTLEKHNNNETKSTIIRRNKVQAWERENSLQQKTSLTYSSTQQNDQFETSEYHRSSFIQANRLNNVESLPPIQTSAITEDDMTMKTTNESIIMKNTSLEISNKEKENLLDNKNFDDLFPMVKILAPYIIIRGSFYRNSNNNRLNDIFSINIDNQNKKKSIQDVNQLIKVSEKRSLNDILEPTLITVKRQSLLL
ncbi:unnamed protein product [Rotaria sp. Silwood2]|nr:unnamed protein product [Rotaria sp. Silwood2]CAF2529233.1 unnamed protein product [Rotaria sp. Silwood2]CAF2940293.1 unnamed protein product [Rotaria sp. Silwood2]CAF3875935.1 unnamed protein product [Rotaria sp. Silwood2]